MQFFLFFVFLFLIVQSVNSTISESNLLKYYEDSVNDLLSKRLGGMDLGKGK